MTSTPEATNSKHCSREIITHKLATTYEKLSIRVGVKTWSLALLLLERPLEILDTLRLIIKLSCASNCHFLCAKLCCTPNQSFDVFTSDITCASVNFWITTWIKFAQRVNTQFFSMEAPQLAQQSKGKIFTFYFKKLIANNFL